MSFKGRLKNNNPTLERSARSQKELRRCSLREKLDRNINLPFCDGENVTLEMVETVTSNQIKRSN